MSDKKYIVLVYMRKSRTVHKYEVDSVLHAREYADRILSEGPIVKEDAGGQTNEVFYSPREVYKVKILDVDDGGGQK